MVVSPAIIGSSGPSRNVVASALLERPQPVVPEGALLQHDKWHHQRYPNDGRSLRGTTSPHYLSGANPLPFPHFTAGVVQLSRFFELGHRQLRQHDLRRCDPRLAVPPPLTVV